MEQLAAERTDLTQHNRRTRSAAAKYADSVGMTTLCYITGLLILIQTHIRRGATHVVLDNLRRCRERMSKAGPHLPHVSASNGTQVLFTVVVDSTFHFRYSLN